MPGKQASANKYDAIDAISRFLIAPPEGTPVEIIKAFELFGRQPFLPPGVFLETVEQAPIAISITDSSARIQYVNAVFEALTGYSRDEVIGQNESILSSKSTPPEVYQDLWHTIQQQKVWQGRLVNHRKNGEEYLAELTIAPVLNDGKEISYYLGMHRDISEVHALQQRLAFQKSLTEAALDAAPMLVAMIDATRKVLLDNLAYKALMADCDGLEPVKLILDAMEQQVGLDLSSVCNTTNSFTNIDVRLDIKRGHSPRWFSCSGVGIPNLDDAAGSFFDSGKPGRCGLLLIANEVTESRRRINEARINMIRANVAEHQLVQTMRESILASIFKMQAPVNIIKAAMSMSAAGNDPVNMTPVLQQALERGEEAIDSLHNALPGPRIEETSALNMNELVQDVLYLYTDQFLAGGIVIDWRAAPVLPSVTDSPNTLRGMLKYLIDNAVQALMESGSNYREIRIETRVEGGQIVISIMDNGVGLPESMMRKVFEPFYCGWKDPRGHAGMGLSMAQEIAINHGGGIEVDPDFIGGCRLFVRLSCDAMRRREHGAT